MVVRRGDNMLQVVASWLLVVWLWGLETQYEIAMEVWCIGERWRNT